MSTSSVRDTTLGRDIGDYLRHQLRGRRGLIVASIGLALPALWFGWPWLVMAGVAPLIIAFAPCAIMCALGLCMMGKSCKKSEVASSAPQDADVALGKASGPPRLLSSTSSDLTAVEGGSLVEAKGPTRAET